MYFTGKKNPKIKLTLAARLEAHCVSNLGRSLTIESDGDLLHVGKDEE